MEDELKKFLSANTFPCIMAKSALRRGDVKFHSVVDLSMSAMLEQVKAFVETYRATPDRLHSLIFGFPTMSFDAFEDVFWKTLATMKFMDRMPSDPRVSADPLSPRFSYSLFSEAFFVIMLHPESPRFARRLPYPAIVFNPHQQFEDLRARRSYFKIRNLIRKKDHELQGDDNIMLDDFGHSSEIFQFTGKKYNGPDRYIEEFYEHYTTADRGGISPEERLEASGY